MAVRSGQNKIPDPKLEDEAPGTLQYYYELVRIQEIRGMKSWFALVGGCVVVSTLR